MRTYQARFSIADDAPLRAYAAILSHALRSLRGARHSGKELPKPQFMRDFNLTSRQYNAVTRSLDGMEASIVELRPGRIADLQQRIKAADKKLAKLCESKRLYPKKRSKRSARKAPRTSVAPTFEEKRAAAARTAERRAFKIHNVERRRADLLRRRAALEAEGHPHICFGGRKFFNAQHHLADNGFDGPDEGAAHAAWLKAWRAKRDAQFFVLGSKDESGGCQGCVMTHLGGNRFTLRLRLRGDKGWRVFLSTEAMETPMASDVRLGAVGVDFNVGFVTVSETDRFGNLIAHQDIPMVTAGLSKHATQTTIGAAVQEVIAIACKAQKPISIEFLEFAKKKAQLSYASPGRQRMLSAFAYDRFDQTLGARAHDAGIELVEVRAAYSSKIGKQKYARRYGLSVHRAAAFVLARRGQKFHDRLKPSSRKRFATTSKDRGELVSGAATCLVA
jgi:IS605 OrfB family transposase